MQVTKRLALVLPSLTAGGMERVMVLLAHYFQQHPQIKPVLIILANVEEFHVLPEGLEVIRPPFDHRKYNRVVFTIKIFQYLKTTLKKYQPEALLCFGGNYNTFAIIASLGLGIRTFISDRSRPNISYGKLLDFLNPIFYKKATGIVAQTGIAKTHMESEIGHSNIKVIGNPILAFPKIDTKKENIILNVGRFIKSKQQRLLIDFFNKIDAPDWKLVFLGNGMYYDECVEYARQSAASDRIHFLGHQTDVTSFYAKSKVFAFTSVSEGFPNALAEAMSAGLASISFDCMAGPADLIEDGVNGFLIPEKDHDLYIERLSLLIKDEALRARMKDAAIKTTENYHINNISKQFEDFLFSEA